MNDAASIDYTVAYFTIAAFCLVPQSFDLVLGGAFAGSGMTAPPMIVGVTFNAVRVPLCAWAAFGLGHGVLGIWWVIAVTASLRGVFMALWFRRNTWKTRTV